MNVSDAYLVSVDYENGVPTHKEYDFDNENSIGANIILENTYSVTKKFKLGVKLFTQPYSNGDMNSGILFKLGLDM
jgi:hypothetical protein